MDVVVYVGAALFDMVLPVLASILLGVAVWAVKRVADGIGVSIDRSVLEGIEEYAGHAIDAAADRLGRKVASIGPDDADIPALAIDATDWLERHVPKWAKRAGLSREDLRAMIEARLP